MILVSMREKGKSGKWIPTAQFDNSGDAYIFCDAIADKLGNMETRRKEIPGDVYKTVDEKKNKTIKINLKNFKLPKLPTLGLNMSTKGWASIAICIMGSISMIASGGSTGIGWAVFALMVIW